MIEKIEAPTTWDGSEGLLAIVVSSDHRPPPGHKVDFITEPQLPLQVALMIRPPGEIIPSHIHLNSTNIIRATSEVLVIRRGVLLVNFYTSDQKWVTNRVLVAGDILILVGGGHGFKVMEEVEMVEIKQGPYKEGSDKVVFKGVTDGKPQ